MRLHRPLLLVLALSISPVPCDSGPSATAVPSELAAAGPQEGSPSRFVELPVRRWPASRPPVATPREQGEDDADRHGDGRRGEEPQTDSGPPLRDFAVQIVAPTGEAPVSGRVRIVARVVADRPERVRFVDFVVDGRPLFSDVRPPYELVWNAGAPANHRIEVRAHGPGRQMVRDVIYTRELPLAATPVSFRIRVDRVQLYVRVIGDGEPSVPGAGAFRVFEDGVEQEVEAVERMSDLPVAVGMLVDCSGSMLERLTSALEATATFVDGLLQFPQDKAYTMAFADLATVLQGFTNDPARLRASLDAVRPGLDTALYDSVIAGVRKFEGIDGRRALVVLTDGHDQGSERRLRDAIAVAQRADIALYPVGVDLSPRFFRERWVLGELARATGGRVSYLYRRDDPTRIYRAIADDLRRQYRITYRPRVPLGNGEWRAVEVRVAGAEDDDLEVRVRPGYYAD